MISRFRLVMFVIPALLMLGATRASASCPPGTTAGPFCIDGTVPDAGVPTTNDPTGSNKELGPVNGSPTKIAVINTAAAPMLAFTNPNNQVDISHVFLKVTQDATTKDQWLYFGWQRDSNTGSGFLSIEFQHNALSSSCDYTGVDFTNPNDPETVALIAACNPWQGRKTGDFIVLWDQQGNLLNPTFPDISKRVFTCVAGTPPTACTLGAPVPLTTAVATVSGDRFFGELAIDLTTDVFEPNTCESFANVIPGTVTGNSDTADYKDTVFATFPPITNCGAISVTKVTLDPRGSFFTDQTNTFGYRIYDNGDILKFPSVTEINGTIKGCKNNATCGGEVQTQTDLVVSSNYTLTEKTPLPGTYSLVSIFCGGKDLHNGADKFAISIGATTECVITNQFPPTNSVPLSQLAARLYDSLKITAGTPGAGDRATTATLRVYKNDPTCRVAGALVATFNLGLTYSADGKTALADTGIGTGGLFVGGELTSPSQSSFYWRINVAADQFNNAIDACTERTDLTFVDDRPIQ